MNAVFGDSSNIAIMSPGYNGEIRPCTHIVIDRPSPFQLPRRIPSTYNSWPPLLTIVNKSGGQVELIQPADPNAPPRRGPDGEKYKRVTGQGLGLLASDGGKSSWVELVDSGDDVHPWVALRWSGDFVEAGDAQ
jgi:hypothetical protein